MKTVRLSSRRMWLVLAALVLTLMTGSVAQAHFFGGKFPYTPGQWLRLGYTQSGSYRTQVLAAASSWHATPTRLILFEEAYANSELDFYGYSYNETWWGYTQTYNTSGNLCYGTGCVYRWATLRLNTKTLGTNASASLCGHTAPFTWQKVAAHEAGHGMGLAHAPGDASYQSIMKQGCVSYNTPRTHDVNDINTLYPYN